MSHKTRRMNLILGAGLTLMAVTAFGHGTAAGFDRAALQAELTPLSLDTRAHAAAAGRAVAAAALAVTRRVALQTQRGLATTRGERAERS